MYYQSNTAAALQFPYTAMSSEELTALYPKSLHQGKNEKNGIAEAIPFLSCPTMFSYRDVPWGCPFLLVWEPHCLAMSHPSSSIFCRSLR